MAWWNDFVAWFNSATGQRIVLSAILPFLAIVVAGVIAAAIGRGSAKRVLAHEDRELQGSAIIALIVVGRKASIWTSLGSDERQHVDSLMSEADIRVRLIPVAGASQAADWAAHQLADMKKNSASFSFQADQTFVDYRDRLLDWQLKPGRARKLFASDLQQWRYEDESPAVAAPKEWTPAPIETTAVAPTPAPAPADAAKWAPSAPEPPTTTGTSDAVLTTPGLATAPPPTVAPMEAPAPVGVTVGADNADTGSTPVVDNRDS
jgi:hypothetical protein